MNPAKIHTECIHSALQYLYIHVLPRLGCDCCIVRSLPLIWCGAARLAYSFQMPDFWFSSDNEFQSVWQQYICNLTICRAHKMKHWPNTRLLDRWHIFDKNTQNCRCIWPTAYSVKALVFWFLVSPIFILYCKRRRFGNTFSTFTNDFPLFNSIKYFCSRTLCVCVCW